MERLPLTRNGSGQQPNKLRDPEKGRTQTQAERKTRKIKQGKKERKRKRTGAGATAERGTILVFPFSYFYFLLSHGHVTAQQRRGPEPLRVYHRETSLLLSPRRRWSRPQRDARSEALYPAELEIV